MINQICFGPEPDLIAHFLRCGMKVEEVSVTMKDRIAGKRYFNFVASFKYMLLMIGSILLVERFRE